MKQKLSKKLKNAVETLENVATALTYIIAIAAIIIGIGVELFHAINHSLISYNDLGFSILLSGIGIIISMRIGKKTQ